MPVLTFSGGQQLSKNGSMDLDSMNMHAYISMAISNRKMVPRVPSAVTTAESSNELCSKNYRIPTTAGQSDVFSRVEVEGCNSTKPLCGPFASGQWHEQSARRAFLGCHLCQILAAMASDRAKE